MNKIVAILFGFFFFIGQAMAETLTCGQIFQDSNSHTIDYFGTKACPGPWGFIVRQDTKVYFLDAGPPNYTRSVLVGNGQGRGAYLMGNAFLDGSGVIIRNWEFGAEIVDHWTSPNQTIGTVENGSFELNDFGVYFHTQQVDGRVRIYSNIISESRETGIMVSGAGSTMDQELYIKDNIIVETQGGSQYDEDGAIVLRHTSLGEITGNIIINNDVLGSRASGILLYNVRNSQISTNSIASLGVRLVSSDLNTFSKIDVLGGGFFLSSSSFNHFFEVCSRVRICNPPDCIITNPGLYNFHMEPHSYGNVFNGVYVENIDYQSPPFGAHFEIMVFSQYTTASNVYRGLLDGWPSLMVWNDSSSLPVSVEETSTPQTCQ